MDDRPDLVMRVARAVTIAGALALGVAAAGSPGWGNAALLAAAAHRLAAGPPGWMMAAKLAALLPFGDIGFRMAALSAVAVAAALAGVIAVGRTLVPDEPIAGTLAAAVAALTPAVSSAACTAGTAAPIAALTVWSVALALRARRAPAGEGTAAFGALLCAGAVLSLDLYPGLLTLATISALVVPARPRTRGAFALAVVALVLPAWSIAGPGLELELTEGVSHRFADLAAGLADGRGAPLVLAGLVGLGLGAMTGLRGAGGVLAAAAVSLLAAALSGGTPAPALLLVATGVVPLAGAVARALAKQPSPRQRLAIGAAAAAPVALLAALAPAGRAPDPGGDVPATAVRAVAGRLPAGPGLVLLRSPVLADAAAFEQAVAGERPDLDLRLRPDVEIAQRNVVIALRAGEPVGSDKAAFGLLDPTLAIPRGRGFQLLLARPTWRADPPAPARWAGANGAALAADLALERGSYEAGNGHLDDAARAAGLVDEGRFDAASLAILSQAVSGPSRPGFFAYIPDLGGPSGWAREVFGDDLAWIAGLDAPPADQLAAAPERRLHEIWREVFLGVRPPDDPAIAAAGRDAEIATVSMLVAVGRLDLARRALTTALAHGDDLRLRALQRVLDE